MKKLVLTCMLSAAAFLFTAANAYAVGLPASPAPGATITSAQPTFTWTVPDGDNVTALNVGTNNHADNGFMDQADVDQPQVTAGQTSWHYTGDVLTPGTYYWQTVGADAEGNTTTSPIQSFVVPAFLTIGKITAHWAPHFDNPRPVDYFESSIRCVNINDQLPYVTLKVFQGKKVLRTESFLGHWCNGKTKLYEFADTYQKPISMKKGTRLTAQFFIKSYGYHFKSAVVTFHAH